MTKRAITKKNLQLTGKLMKYLVDHPEVDDKLPDDASFVLFTHADKKLNAINAKLAQSLAQSGTAVVKAMETKDKQHPWKFTS